VSKVRAIVPNTAIANTSHDIVMRYWYCVSQLFIKTEDKGMEIQHAITVNTTKSFDNIFHKFATLAPSTFRMPISLVRCSATKDARPKRPRHEIKMASTAKRPARFPMRSSLE